MPAMSSILAMVLVIRVFDRSGDVAADRLAALRTAGAILRQAGISSHWVDCSASSAARPSATCAAPLAPHELALRITPGPQDDGVPDKWTLGYSLVEPTTGKGTLATVFSDRVTWLAEAAKSPRPVLMGRVVAHELGHLLIGTSEHSPAGLMRAKWTSDDVARDRREDWLFTPADRARLRKLEVGDADATRVASTFDELVGDS